MPEQRPEGRWARLGRALMRPSRSQVLVAVVLALSGLAVTMQVSTVRDQRFSTLRQADLVAMLDDVTAESRRLESELAELERTRSQLQSGVDAGEVARAEARKRLDDLGLLGGTLPARGQGIRITISDSRGKLTPEILLNAIEELRDAGAEVIEIDDRIRLVAGSAVTGAAGAVVVDGVGLGRTIVLEAIGDPATLNEATRFRGGLVSTIEGERVDGSAQVVRVPDLLIASVVTPRTPRFARPV